MESWVLLRIAFYLVNSHEPFGPIRHISFSEACAGTALVLLHCPGLPASFISLALVSFLEVIDCVLAPTSVVGANRASVFEESRIRVQGHSRVVSAYRRVRRVFVNRQRGIFKAMPRFSFGPRGLYEQPS